MVKKIRKLTLFLFAEAEFERQQYMVGPERLYLAHTLQLTEAQVKFL
jgi:Homeodomain